MPDTQNHINIRTMKNVFFLIWGLWFISLTINAQEANDLNAMKERLNAHSENVSHRLDQLEKAVDDILWYQKVGDIAHVDKLYIYGPPRWKENNPDAMGAGNPVKFWTYVFIPLATDASEKYPLIVLPHGGVHSNFTTYYTHIIRELVSQGYVVVAPEYRGSTGYGRSHYEKIDYGGLETEDVYYTRNFMIETYDFIDRNNVGIVGWSHGGLIALMNIFDHPEDYQAAFAGVPVSDLIARMGYQTQGYRDLYEAEYHIGQSANENVAEYRRRSPAWNTHKFQNTPLLIHTNTNDDDVNVLEVEHLIKSLKAEGKDFKYEIFENLPGGHSFDRMDTPTAKKIRLKVYLHLAKYLNPPKPIKNLRDLQQAGYKF
jgi:dienelactone hydrolase